MLKRSRYGRALPMFFFAWAVVVFCTATPVVFSEAFAADEVASGSAEDLYGKARKAFRNGELEKALELLQKAYDLEARPLFVYNIGRVQASLGNIREAYETYLRVLALDGLDDDLRRLTDAQAIKLKGMVDKAVLRIVEVPEGALVQVGSRSVKKPGQEQLLDAGTKQACAIVETGVRALCTFLDLRAGRRVDWAPLKPEGAVGTMLWTPVSGVQGIVLNGETLLVDVQTIRSIQVDVGNHEVQILGADGGSVSLKVHILPAARKNLAKLMNPSQTSGTPTRTLRRAVSKGAPREGQPSAGPWPWVVSGTGVVVAGVGVFFVQSAVNKMAEVASVDKDESGIIRGENQLDAVDAWDEASSEHNLGLILCGVGGAALVGGITWWLIDQPSGVQARRAIQNDKRFWAGISPDGSFLLGGRF